MKIKDMVKMRLTCVVLPGGMRDCTIAAWAAGVASAQGWVSVEAQAYVPTAGYITACPRTEWIAREVREERE